MSLPATALVTGAAAGLGRAIAHRLAEDGYDLLLLDVDAKGLDETASELAQQMPDIHVRSAPLDLADLIEIQRLPQHLEGLRSPLKVLVNNAGISPKRDGRRVKLEETELEADWLRVLQVNLTAPFMLAQIVAPGMRHLQWGRIINISSLAARCPSGLASLAYTTTKTGLLGLTRALAQEVARDGITVNCIAPGRFATAMGENLAPQDKARIAEAIPVGRWGEPAEVAGLVSYLCRDESRFITGAVLDINGGAVMV